MQDPWEALRVRTIALEHLHPMPGFKWNQIKIILGNWLRGDLLELYWRRPRKVPGGPMLGLIITFRTEELYRQYARILVNLIRRYYNDFTTEELPVNRLDVDFVQALQANHGIIRKGSHT